MKWMVIILMLLVSVGTASAATVYVDTDGTGDYNCDGVNDYIEINWALNNSSYGDIVHINASTYYINDSIWINNSGVTMEGDGDTTILYLPTNLAWAQTKRMTYANAGNITIQNLLFDGNTFNQTVPAGANYHVIVEVLTTNHDATFQSCTFKDTRDDAIIPSASYRLLVDDCYFLNVNHGGVEGDYYDSIISNNRVFVNQNTQGMNAGFRLYYGSNNTFSNNTITKDPACTRVVAYGFEIHAYNNNNVSYNTFEDNVIQDVFTRGFHFDAAVTSTDIDTLRGVVIRNNIVDGVIWDNSGFGQGIYMDGLWNNWTIENNVIYDARCGIEEMDGEPSGGNIVIKNNIITGNSDYGIWTNTTNFVLSYNDVWGNTVENYNGTSPGIGDISSDPLFTNPTTHDFHINSTIGRWTGSAWTTDATSSPCIDTGDPTSTYSNEPAPNGDRINIGAYGNTDEASMSEAENLIAAANKYIQFNDWTTDQTFAQIAALNSNDVCYSWYNHTIGLYEAYYVGRSYNANAVIPQNCSVFGYFDAQTEIETTYKTSITIPDACWFYGFLPGSTNQTLSQIQVSMDADGLDCWAVYRWDGTSNNATGTVQPNEGISCYVNNTGDWTS